MGVVLGPMARRQIRCREGSELHYLIDGLLCSETRISANNFSPGKHYLNPGFLQSVNTARVLLGSREEKHT